MLHTSTVDAQTLELLKQIQNITIFRDLRLVGGTGLALQYGHRKSVDIDLFGTIQAEDIEIKKYLGQLGSLKAISLSASIKIFILNNIKIDIVNYPYPWLFDAITENNITLANDKDIAAMKLSAITNRGSKKDFIDIYFLLQRYPLSKLLNLYEKKYQDGSIFFVLKSLQYFDDAEKDNMPQMLKYVTWNEVKIFIENTVKKYVKQK